jgi:hypothetical protein
VSTGKEKQAEQKKPKPTRLEQAAKAKGQQSMRTFVQQMPAVMPQAMNPFTGFGYGAQSTPGQWGMPGQMMGMP